jgi:DNA-binding NarL/FixJ family response regulator
MTPSAPKRVVLCDDHEIVREAIKARMASVEDVEIVGEAETGEQVVDRVRELEPDVCIVDVELPGKDGIDATKDIIKERPETRVIIFTAHAQPDLLTLALRAGASGYVLKSAPSEDIARAIEVVAGGGTFVGTELGQGAGEVEKLLELTPREREILELLAQGLSNRAIAGALGISEHTVKFHLASIYGKLGASTRTGAVRRALRRGLITI